MIWHLAQLLRKCGCHIMQPICHTVISALWQQTLCSHSICHMIIQSKWQTRKVDVHISCRPVQLDAETALTTDCGNYQSVETITNNSEKIRSHNEKACLWLLSYKFSKIQFATWKSVGVATIIVIQ